MKKLLAVTVLTLLGAGFVAAQSPQEMGNTATPGATFATGTVTFNGNDSIVIKKDSGDSLTVFFDNATVGGKNNAIGSRVQVNYRIDNGRPIAIEVRGPKAGEPLVATTSTTATSTTTLAPPAPAPSVSVTTTTTPAPVADVDVDVDVDTPPSPSYSASASRELPATASNGPAIALLGLLALGAAVVVRAAR